MHSSSMASIGSCTYRLCELIGKNGVSTIFWPSCSLSTSVNSKLKIHPNCRRKNDFGIPMIPENLRQKLFGDEIEPSLSKDQLDRTRKAIKSLTKTKDFDGNNSSTKNFNSVDDSAPSTSTQALLDFPPLHGKNIKEHFEIIANDLVKNYKKLLIDFMSDRWTPPPMPLKWSKRSGWTKYDSITGHALPIPFPPDDVLVFDVEVCVSIGSHPIIATAVSKTAWYSWCSKRLDDSYLGRRVKNPFDDLVTATDLIPVETTLDSSYESINLNRERIIIGHNVGFDRTFLREQYFIQGTKLRFFDTMSAHIAVSGLAGDQRVEFQYHKTGRRTKAYADATGYDKRRKQVTEESKLFSAPWIDSTSMNNLADVHEFYCGSMSELKLSKDERKTFLDGSLEDVASNFQNLTTYCAKDAAATLEVYKVLAKLFFERFPSSVTLNGMMEMSTTFLTVNENWFHYLQSADETFRMDERRVKKLLIQQCDRVCSLLHTKKWYRNLCRENRLKRTSTENGCSQKSEHWDTAVEPIHLVDGFDFGPSSISVQKQITPKLLRLQWENFPLYYSSKYGWGYLVPKDGLEMDDLSHLKDSSSVLKILRNSAFYTLKFPLRSLISLSLSKPHNRSPNELLCKIPGFEKLAVNYVKLPHKDGPENNVGNPLAKDFMHYIDQHILSSQDPSHAQLLATLTQRCSYWKNNADRIQKLLLLWLPDNMLPENLTNFKRSVGIILPRLVVAGTVTRRAVEPTWMTVSNAKADRIGSELKAMIQAPNNYCFVGADVDSQELWIAGLLADSSKYKVHGCTPFSFMLLKGTKADQTDQHSVVAKTLGISRDQAKIINYGRFYGAGLNYAARLLQQFKPRESETSIKSAAVKLYKFTKGVRTNASFRSSPSQLASSNVDTATSIYQIWKNGSESDLFNCLESIARSPKPETPVLNCRISRSLEPEVVGDKFLPSRINWIIQSSAVDFLHSLLTCMRWLCNEHGIDARFCISVHDEVRYLAAEKDKCRAALALQLSNLLTRSFFVYSVGMRDLPLSVAYFNQVDVDKTLRKESNDDCITPSNPLGLQACYNVPKGQALPIEQIIDKIGQRI